LLNNEPGERPLNAKSRYDEGAQWGLRDKCTFEFLEYGFVKEANGSLLIGMNPPFDVVNDEVFQKRLSRVRLRLLGPALRRPAAPYELAAVGE
jgi:hypothetical protein